MLRACAISFPEKWDECLTLAEFSYNNSYQESIRMAPFEALYGKKCRTPLNRVEVGDHGYFGLDFKLESKSALLRVIWRQLKVIRKLMRTREEGPCNLKLVIMCISKCRPWGGASLWCPGKASPSLCWTLQDFGSVWFYCLPIQLLDILSTVHNVFHVSQLEKCLQVPRGVVELKDSLSSLTCLILSILSRS